MKIVFASNNQHKLHELQTLLKKFSIQLVSQAEFKIKEVKEIRKTEFKVKRIKLDWIYLLIGVTAITSFLFFLIYQFDFPNSKEFIKNYYAYFIAGISISLFIIFLIEFYKPLFNLLKRLNQKKK